MNSVFTVYADVLLKLKAQKTVLVEYKCLHKKKQTQEAPSVLI